MNLTPDELNKLCHGCNVILQGKCWIRNIPNKWKSECPCCGCMVSLVCCESCEQLSKWMKTIK